MRKYQIILIPFLASCLCIATGYKAINLNQIYDIYFCIGFFIPCITEIFWHSKYNWFCSFAAAASVFLLPNHHGFAGLIPAAVLLLWNLGHILIWRFKEKLRFPFMLSCLYETILISFALAVGIPAAHYLAKLNTYYPFGYAYSYLPYNILNACMVFLSEMLILVFFMLELLRMLPAVQHLIEHKNRRNEFKDHQFIFLIFLMAIIVFVLSIPSGRETIAYFSISINPYENAMGNLQLLLFKEILVFLIGNLIVHFLEYRYRQEAEKLETAETAKAVFESSNDMIWSINGKNNDIILANSLAQNFFQKKSNKKSTDFLSIFDKNEIDIWSAYIAEGLEKGKFITEYYDEMMKKYYSLVVSKVSLNQDNYDIAFFAKDITEEVELNEQIRNMNNRLEEQVYEKTKDLQHAYRDLNQYTHQIAHEIKAPLRAIKLYNEIVKENPAANQDTEVIEASDQIEHYCNKSISILTEILDYASTKTQTLRYEKINMESLVYEILDELQDIYQSQSVSYSIKKLPWIDGDRNLLRSCIFNILSNSFKYSSKKEKTIITISCEKSNDTYIFSFQDNGDGFDMKYADHLFEMFCRMHTDSEFEGTGIGLALAKNVIHRHGGEIWAQAYPHEGCTIFFSLPVRSQTKTHEY